MEKRNAINILKMEMEADFQMAMIALKKREKDEHKYHMFRYHTLREAVEILEKYEKDEQVMNDVEVINDIRKRC